METSFTVVSSLYLTLSIYTVVYQSFYLFIYLLIYVHQLAHQSIYDLIIPCIRSTELHMNVSIYSVSLSVYQSINHF